MVNSPSLIVIGFVLLLIADIQKQKMENHFDFDKKNKFQIGTVGAPLPHIRLWDCNTPLTDIALELKSKSKSKVIKRDLNY